MFGPSVFMTMPSATALLAPSGIVIDLNAEWRHMTGDDQGQDAGTPLWRRFAPAERNHIAGLVERARESVDNPDARPQVTGTQVRHVDGQLLDVALRVTATRDNGALVLIAQIERLPTPGNEATRRAGTGDRHLALATIARSVSTGTDLRRVGETVVTAVARATGCPLVGLWRRASRHEHFVLMEGLGFGDSARGHLVLEGHPDGLAEHTIRTRSAVVIGGPSGTAALLPRALTERGVTSGAAVPLHGSAGDDGLLTVGAVDNQPMDHDLRFLDIVGDLLTVTLQRESVDHVIGGERRRAAQIAHDLQTLELRHQLAVAAADLRDWCWVAPDTVTTLGRGTVPPWSVQICLDGGPQALIECAVAEDADALATALNAAFAEGTEIEARARLRTTEGMVEVRLRGVIERDANGAARQAWGVAAVTRLAEPHATVDEPRTPTPEPQVIATRPSVPAVTTGAAAGSQVPAVIARSAADGRGEDDGRGGDDLGGRADVHAPGTALVAARTAGDPRLAHTAHDLNNLLAAVLGTAEQLIARGGDRRRLTAIVRAGRRARDLVAGLGPADDDAHPLAGAYDLSDVVDQLRPLLHGLVGDYARLVFQLGRGARTSRPAREELEHALLDLVANSRDALNDGGTIVIATDTCVQLEDAAGTQGPPAGSWARLRVCDNGGGMTPEDRERMFTPGFSTKRGHGHAGLGLAAVRRTITRAGGTIGVDSAPGRGTVVDLFLPLTARRGTRLQPLRAAQPAATPASGPASRVALVVDDEPALRHLLPDLLGRLGYDAVVAADGAGALALAHEVEHLELVVSDLLMPGMDGLQVARRVREVHPRVGVVLLSGAPVRTAITDRDLRVLRKPFEWTDLRDAVLRVTADAAAPPRTPLPAVGGGS